MRGNRMQANTFKKTSRIVSELKENIHLAL